MYNTIFSPQMQLLPKLPNVTEVCTCACTTVSMHHVLNISWNDAGWTDDEATLKHIEAFCTVLQLSAAYILYYYSRLSLLNVPPKAWVFASTQFY